MQTRRHALTLTVLWREVLSQQQAGDTGGVCRARCLDYHGAQRHRPLADLVNAVRNAPAIGNPAEEQLQFSARLAHQAGAVLVLPGRKDEDEMGWGWGWDGDGDGMGPASALEKTTNSPC